MKNKIPKNNISVVIVTHNAMDFLKETLTSLFKQKGISLETIVVDNKSTDQTRAMLKKFFPKVHLLTRNTPVGFASANNLGIKHSHADTILFLNPDVTFGSDNDLKKCYSRLYDNPKVGAISPRVNLVKTGLIDETCHRGFPTPWASLTHFSGLSQLFPHVPIFNQYTKNYLGYNNEHSIDSVGGMFMLVKKTAGQSISWWDEDFAFYGEDIDFCYRLWQHNYSVLYYPQVKVLHYKGITTGMSKQSKELTTAKKETIRRVKAWSVQAMEIFYRKHYQQKYPFFVNWLVYLGLKLMYLRRVTFAWQNW